MVLLGLTLCAPLSGFAVVFTNDAAIPAGDPAYDEMDILVDGATLTVDGEHLFASISLTNGAILTHTQGETGLWLRVMGPIDVYSNCAINADGCGTLVDDSTGSSGGSYGGRGEDYGGASGAAHGNYLEPSDLGSGGAGSFDARGGGAVRIEAGTMMLHGELTANGG